MRTSGENPSRRQFLRGLGAAAVSVAVPLRALSTAETKKAPWVEEPKGPYAPFRMALQSYSLRKFDFQKAVETTFDLRLSFIDLWPDHFPMNLGDSEFRLHLKAMRQNLVRRIAYGVVEFTKDDDKNREIFEFAKKLNVYAVTANPAPDSFDSLDKLVEKYGIAVGVHNHGPEDKRYGTPDLIEKAIKDHNKLIGLCIDTGHFLRAGVKPVDAMKAFKERIYAVHLKDVKSEGGKQKETIVGQGDLDLVPFLRALKESGFKGGLALEYEDDPDNPVPAMKKCLEAIQDAVKKL